MEKDNFSAEQDVSDQSVETVEYPEFNPDKAKKLQEIGIAEVAIRDEKVTFCMNVDKKIASGDLPSQLWGRKGEFQATQIKVVPDEQIEVEQENLEGHTASHIIEYYGNKNDDVLSRYDEIRFPEDVLEYEYHEQMIRHEFAHTLEGHSNVASPVDGLKRLFKDEHNYLGVCINEGMTEHMAELVSEQKNIYKKDKKNDKIPGYQSYYKFIKFLSSAGVVKVDMKYFVDAYCLSGDEGDKAIATLRDKLAEAFPTENGVNALDNLAAHNKDQIEYWISTYTQAIN